MSMPNIPDIKPDINLDREKSIDLLITSVALEELALSHIVNAEAEKIQFVLGTLEDYDCKEPATIDELLEINKAVGKMLKKVIEKETLLEFMLENSIDLTKSSKNQNDNGEEDKDDNENNDIEEVSASHSVPTYTGNGGNRVGSITVTLTFTLSNGTTVTETETFSNINTTTIKNFIYTIGKYEVTVKVTVSVAGTNNSMNIVGVTAEITSKIVI